MAENVVVTVPKSLRARLQTGIAWNLVGAAFNQGSTLVVNIIVANLLGRETFGEYAVIQSTLATTASIAAFGTGYTATKYLAEFRSTDKPRAGRIMALCSVTSATTACIAALVLLIGAPWLAANALKAPHLASALMIAAAVAFFNVMNWYQMGALSGLESYRALGVGGIISGSLYLAICTVAAYLGGLTGVLIGVATSAFIQWLLLNWLLRRESARQGIVSQYRDIGQEGTIIWKFALPTALPSFTTMPALWLASVFLVRQADGYTQMALYSAANNFRIIVLFLPNIVNNVGMSLLNYQKGLRDEDRYRKVFRANMALTVGSVVMGALAVVLFGPFLMGVFGKSFSQGFPVLLVLMLATLPEALWYLMSQVISSHEKMWSLFLVGILPRDACMVLLAYLLSSRGGAVGLASAYTISWLLALVVAIMLVGRIGLSASGRKDRPQSSP